jgi:hypothetical protein
MGEVFAQNIDAALTDPASVPAGQGGISGISLAFTLIAERARAFLRRMFGR